MKASSWECKGCTNICHLLFDGEVFTYCKPMVFDGGNRTEWHGNHVSCLDYTTDPKKHDVQVRLHPAMLKA